VSIEIGIVIVGTWHVCDYALGLFVGSAIENNYTNISSYNQSCDFTYAAYTCSLWIF